MFGREDGEFLRFVPCVGVKYDKVHAETIYGCFLRVSAKLTSLMLKAIVGVEVHTYFLALFPVSSLYVLKCPSWSCH